MDKNSRQLYVKLTNSYACQHMVNIYTYENFEKIKYAHFFNNELGVPHKYSFNTSSFWIILQISQETYQAEIQPFIYICTVQKLFVKDRGWSGKEICGWLRKCDKIIKPVSFFSMLYTCLKIESVIYLNSKKILLRSCAFSNYDFNKRSSLKVVYAAGYCGFSQLSV